MKILVATDKPFAKKAINEIRNVIESAGYELCLLEKYTQKQQLLEAVSSANALIIRSDLVDAEVIASAPNLKIVVRAGAGYDNVDLKAATEAGLVVMNTPGQNANAVAELVFGMLVYAVRQCFNGSSGTELKGKTIGIHAYGNVGRNVARIAKGFGMEILAYDAYCSNEMIAADGVKPVHSATELYAKSDIISLHIPATDDTRKSINHSLLQLLPKGAIIVNTARKEVINEVELLQFMQTHPDFRYLTDIAPDLHTRFLELPTTQYFSTPSKIGAQTAEANINAGIAAAEQIVDYFKNGNQRFRVN